MLQVTVKHDEIYYKCLVLSTTRIKCGKCLFGLINPFGKKSDMSDRCKRCGARLSRTVYGDYWLTAKVYTP